jgi:hypothetical protein
MLQYNQNDLSKLDDWEAMLNHLGEDLITEEEVWSIARESNEVPLIENILLELTASKLHYVLSKKYPNCEFNYFINAIDSHFYCNNEEIYSIEDVEDSCEEQI